eukprot:3617893-Amphidinium_carterae.1
MHILRILPSSRTIITQRSAEGRKQELKRFRLGNIIKFRVLLLDECVTLHPHAGAVLTAAMTQLSHLWTSSRSWRLFQARLVTAGLLLILADSVMSC